MKLTKIILLCALAVGPTLLHGYVREQIIQKRGDVVREIAGRPIKDAKQKDISKVLAAKTKELKKETAENKIREIIGDIASIISQRGIDPKPVTGTTAKTYDFVEMANKKIENNYNKNNWGTMKGLLEACEKAGEGTGKLGTKSLYNAIKGHRSLSAYKATNIQLWNVRYGVVKKDEYLKSDNIIGSRFADRPSVPLELYYKKRLGRKKLIGIKNMDVSVSDMTPNRVEEFLDSKTKMISRIKTGKKAELLKLLAEVNWVIQNLGINHKTVSKFFRVIHPSTVKETWKAIEAADKIYNKKFSGDVNVKKAIKEIIISAERGKLNPITNDDKYSDEAAKKLSDTIKNNVGKNAFAAYNKIREAY